MNADNRKIYIIKFPFVNQFSMWVCCSDKWTINIRLRSVYIKLKIDIQWFELPTPRRASYLKHPTSILNYFRRLHVLFAYLNRHIENFTTACSSNWSKLLLIILLLMRDDSLLWTFKIILHVYFCILS